jgi:hypothetical protein
MTGEWFQNRGVLVDIPQNGGPGICAGATLGEGCLGGLKPRNGGIPNAAGATVNVAGPNNTITVPTNAFSQPAPSPSTTFAVTITPQVVQLATAFNLLGPTAAGVLKKSAWLTDPNQVGRPATGDFSWCPGGPNPNCLLPTTGGAAISGTLPHRVVYTTTANKFGGTMAMFIQGGGSIVVRTSTGVANGPVQVNPIGGGAGNAQAVGGGYVNIDTNVLLAGGTYSTYNTSIPCTGPPYGGPQPTNCGHVTTLGANTGVGANQTNTNWGFPWTTGMVTVINKGTIGGNPQSTSITVTGNDGRNAIGAGNITLVAGGSTHRLPANQDFSALDIVSMRLVAPVPALSPAGLAIGIAALALSAGYALRRRF